MTGKREREGSRKIQKTLSTNANQVEEEKMMYTEDVGKESSCTDNAAGARSLAKYLAVNTKQKRSAFKKEDKNNNSAHQKEGDNSNNYYSFTQLTAAQRKDCTRKRNAREHAQKSQRNKNKSLGPSSFVLIIAINAAAKQRGPRLFFWLWAITTSEGDKNTKLPPPPPTPRGVSLGEGGMGARTQAAQQRAKHMDEKWQHFHQKFDFYLTLFYFSFPWPGPLLSR